MLGGGLEIGDVCLGEVVSLSVVADGAVYNQVSRLGNLPEIFESEAALVKPIG